MKKINSQTMREHNMRSILNVVRRSGPITRVDVAKELGLTPSAVTNIVSILINDGLLVERGLSESAKGRKPVLLDINSSVGCVLGIVLTVEYVTVVLSDFSSNITHTERRPISPMFGKESIISTMVECANLCMQQAEKGGSFPLGIGLAVPAPLDKRRGMMIDPPNFPDWRNVPICEIMERELGIPARLDKETNAAALAEYYFGTIDEHQTAFYVLINKNSIGGSVMRYGNVLHGFEDGAGDIGHTLVDTNGPKCTCGRYGCLERVACGDALVSKARSSINAMKAMNQKIPCSPEELTIEDIFRFSEEGVPLFCEIVDHAALMVATAIGNVVSLISPSLIVIAGQLAEISPKFVAQIRSIVNNMQYYDFVKRIKIEPSALGDSGCARGASMLALDAFQTKLYSQE